MWYLVFACVVGVWAGLTWLVWAQHGDVKEAGPFGDMFGAVNALFTGLAFAGVICALWIQNTQAKHAQLEASQTEREVREARLAFLRTTYAMSFKTASDILQVDRVRDARRIVIVDLRQKPLVDWLASELAAAELVCHTYEQVGMLVKNGLLPTRFIAEGWCDSLLKCWSVCEPLVKLRRAERGAHEFWCNFEYLAMQATRFHKETNGGRSIAT